jgi:aminoglycoside phosphotransferase (APT) family kinase protein
VICHGDLHPFNLLVDGSRVTLLDRSTALLASRSYDVACTSLVLSEAALEVPGRLRPPARWIGRRMAGHWRGRHLALNQKTGNAASVAPIS